jgi:hypothetical protein
MATEQQGVVIELSDKEFAEGWYAGRFIVHVDHINTVDFGSREDAQAFVDAGLQPNPYS